MQAAALDEMFHQGEASTQRYHKALLLMEGLTQLLTEEDDIVSVGKCEGHSTTPTFDSDERSVSLLTFGCR